MMLKVETLAIALCVVMLAGLAVYTVDILNVSGTDGLIQQAEAIRRSTHQCIPPTYIVGCI
jgi:hypothetical protein